MAFPSNPQLGQIHTEYGHTYVWDGIIWLANWATTTPDGEVIVSSPIAPTAATGVRWHNPRLKELRKYDGANWALEKTIGNVGVSSYSITSTVAAVNEGEQVNFTILANNVADGTKLSYTITGIEAADISEAESVLSGFVTVNSGSATVTLTLLEDNTTEGTQYITLEVPEVAASHTVVVYDTSVTPYYSLSASTSQRSETPLVNQFYVYIQPYNKAGETVNYTVTGITADDLNVGSLSGSFTVNSNNDPVAIAYNIKADELTEGTETFTFTIVETGQSVNVTILDTSLSPEPPAGGQFTISFTDDSNNPITTVSEGGFIGVNVTNNSATNGTYSFEVTGISSADIVTGSSDPMAGSWPEFGGGASFGFTIAADGLSEGTETFTFTITETGDSASITITDA